ncbi:MAG: isochorismatase family protein [Gammaproteobacteria bacterium]
MTTHPNLLAVETSLLVVIDIQKTLLAAMNEQDSALLGANVKRLLNAAGLLHVPVLLTEQYPKGLGMTDSVIKDSLPESACLFDKTGFSCCAAEGFAGVLAKQRRSQIILAGIEAHVCVLQTALELRHSNYQVHVVEDATLSRRADHKLNALRRMERQDITITNHESVMFEWLRDAKHPQFKSISALLR